MHTPQRTIEVAKISEYLFLDKIQRGGLYGEGTDLELPYKIYNIRKSVEWAFNHGGIAYNNNAFEATLNYLYAICTPYNIQAEAILGKIGMNVTANNSSRLITENGLYLITENT